MFSNLKEAIDVLLYGPKQAEIEYIKMPPEVQYKVVEVRAPRITQAWTKEIKEAVGTLSSHPGFIALMDRMALQRQMLEHKCSHEFHKDTREVDYLQAGVFWLGYAQELVAKATKLQPSAPMDAFQEELDAFKELDSKIERIGMEPQVPQQR